MTVENRVENNKANIIGRITKEAEYSHTVNGERFYETEISCTRGSGAFDLLKVIASEVFLYELTKDNKVEIKGRFSSFNKDEGENKHLILTIFAKEVETVDSINDLNELIIETGYVVKEPVYRKTPRGREITELLIAVNRPYGKADYIPCIAWGRFAQISKNFEIGQKISAIGRMQSRDYEKKINENETEQRTTYEVSLKRIERIENEE